MTPARWFARWRKQRAAPGATGPRPGTAPPSSVFIGTRTVQVSEQQAFNTPYAFVMPFRFDHDFARFRKLQRLELEHLPNPAHLNDYETQLAAAWPNADIIALLREPVTGLGPRLHMGRN